MTNVLVMYNPYFSKEKNHYLFGYTYIPKETSEEKIKEEQKVSSKSQRETKQIGGITFVFDKK